jgi:hypothetical protein
MSYSSSSNLLLSSPAHQLFSGEEVAAGIVVAHIQALPDLRIESLETRTKQRLHFSEKIIGRGDLTFPPESQHG